jgi:hypothetical protein
MATRRLDIIPTSPVASGADRHHSPGYERIKLAATIREMNPMKVVAVCHRLDPATQDLAVLKDGYPLIGLFFMVITKVVHDMSYGLVPPQALNIKGTEMKIPPWPKFFMMSKMTSVRSPNLVSSFFHLENFLNRVSFRRLLNIIPLR